MHKVKDNIFCKDVIGPHFKEVCSFQTHEQKDDFYLPEASTVMGVSLSDPRMILFCGRRTLCHQDFRFYLSTKLPKPSFSASIAATTTLVNFGVSTDTLIEDLLSRTFARIRPELHHERITALRNLQLLKDTLFHLSQVLKSRVLSSGHQVILNSPKSLQFITNITQARLQVCWNVCLFI